MNLNLKYILPLVEYFIMKWEISFVHSFLYPFYSGNGRASHRRTRNISQFQQSLMVLLAPHQDRTKQVRDVITQLVQSLGAPFVKIVYLTDLAQKLLSLRILSYLCAGIAISARR